MSTAARLIPAMTPAHKATVGAGARASLLEAIDAIIGAELAAKLCSDFGGHRLYIPHRPARGDVLARSIGLDAACKLADVYGGDRLDVPADPIHARRRMRIAQLRAAGLSVSAIARRLRCTERYVYKVMAAAREP